MWTALGAVALWIGNGNLFTNFYDGVMMLSILNLTLGVAVFWAGSEITATNIYGFAFALFVGFAGIFTLTSYSQGVYIPYLLDAAACAYFGQAFIYCTWWYVPRRIAKGFAARRSTTTANHVTQWGVTVGAVLFAAGVVGAVEPGRTSFVRPRLPAVCSCAPQHLFGRARDRPLRGLVAASALLIMARLVFSGFGRLELGAFGLAIALAASARFGGRAIKIAVLMVSTPVMLYLAQEREAFFVGVTQTTTSTSPRVSARLSAPCLNSPEYSACALRASFRCTTLKRFSRQ